MDASVHRYLEHGLKGRYRERFADHVFFGLRQEQMRGIVDTLCFHVEAIGNDKWASRQVSFRGQSPAESLDTCTNDL